MNWKRYWNEIAKLNANSSAGQVQRDEQENTLITVNYICKQLDIKKTDIVLDVCCGNGMITLEVAKRCTEIIGIDHSEELLNIANQNNSKINCSFHLTSALELKKAVDEQLFDKIYLQFSFQYFDKKNQGFLVIKEMLACLKPEGKIFIGDITNHSKLDVFFESKSKRMHYYYSSFRGVNSMGKFWKTSELEKICKKLEVNGTYLEQPKELPYSYYRFDFLIKN